LILSFLSSLILHDFNRPDAQAAEIPAANGVGQVRSIARLYGEVATGGAALGLTDAAPDFTSGTTPGKVALREAPLHPGPG
jgi:hypothetical protein